MPHGNLGKKYPIGRCIKSGLGHRKYPGSNHFYRQMYKFYKITESEYKLMLKSQKGVCGICHKPETIKLKRTLRRLSIDHDHKTNRVRGLLCYHCNLLLGNAQDDPGILRKAMEYLVKTS